MASSQTVVLDTTPPQVTWAPPAVAAPGETLRVPYTVNEPELDEAVLVLPGGAEVPLSVDPAEVWAVLASNTPTGTATVRAVARDEVGNEAVGNSPPFAIAIAAGHGAVRPTGRGDQQARGRGDAPARGRAGED